MRIHHLAKQANVNSRTILELLDSIGVDAKTPASKLALLPIEKAAFEDAFLGGHVHTPKLTVQRQEFGINGYEQTICECGLTIVESETEGWSTKEELDRWFLNLMREAGFHDRGHFMADQHIYEPIAQSVAQTIEEDK